MKDRNSRTDVVGANNEGGAEESLVGYIVRALLSFALSMRRFQHPNNDDSVKGQTAIFSWFEMCSPEVLGKEVWVSGGH